MKAILKELQVFIKRDLQDYRLKDYFALSHGARWCLLSVLLPCLLLIFFFLWRYFWGTELLAAHISSQQKIEQQLRVIQKEIKSHQSFLTEAEGIDFQDIVNDVTLENLAFSEVDLIHQVETLLLASGLMQLALRPQKMEVIFSEKRAGHRSEPLPVLASELTTALMPVKSAVERHSSSTTSTLDEQKVIMLELELSVCGQYTQLFSFFMAIEKLLPIFYLDKLSVVEKTEKNRSCPAQNLENQQVYNLVLQFFDLNTLHHAYQYFLETESSSAISGFPISITDLQSDMNQVRSYSLNDSDHDNDLEEQPPKSDDFLQSLQILFQEAFSEKISTNLPNAISKRESINSENLYRWKIGEMHQGMRLVGIIMQEKNSFAVIEDWARRWAKVRVGEHHIIRMKSDYLELQLPTLGVTSEPTPRNNPRH